MRIPRLSWRKLTNISILGKALDIISAQASIIEVLGDDKDLQYQKMQKIETENEELLVDIQDLIEENKELVEDLESVRKENRELEVRNKQLECDREPLLRKLEVSRQESKQLEEHMRVLGGERDYLLDELTRAREKISILLIFASNELSVCSLIFYRRR